MKCQNYLFSPTKQRRMTERVDCFNYPGKNGAEDDHQNLRTIYFSTQHSKALVQANT